MVLMIPGILTASFLSLFYCMMPEGGRKGRMAEYEKQYIAHRGFHDNHAECPENTLAAFQKAVEAGYGIELDVQLTKDEIPVVVHDYDLKRICGINKKVLDCTYEELKRYTVCRSNEAIPALKDVLRLVSGRVPLVIELKVERKFRKTCERVTELLDYYHGSYCIESFSPLALWWFKIHRPQVLRGQLATNHWREGLKSHLIIRAILTNCLLNGFCKPDFIAYNCQFTKTLPVTVLRKIYKCKMAAWTIKSQKELERHRKYFDVFIFDGFLPERESG